VKVSKKTGLIVAGVVGCAMLFGGTAIAKSLTERISVRFANIKLIVNDKVIPTKAEPFVYNGNVYAPVATVANMLNINQEWDNKTPAVRFDDRPPFEMLNPKEEVISLGDHVYLYRWHPADTYTVKIGTKSNMKEIALPAVEKAGYHTVMHRVSGQFANITGQSDKEFLVANRLVNDSPEGELYVNLLRYENGAVQSVSKLKIPFYSQAVYVEETRELLIRMYDGAALAKEETYQWKNGSFVKTAELSRQ
jgi:hypothetical protein